MAEAAVEERPTTRFFCHRCDVEFENASADCICPRCSEGFVEKLEAVPSLPDDDWDDFNQQGNVAVDIINQIITLLGGSVTDVLPSPPREGGGRSLRANRGVEGGRRRRYASQIPDERTLRARGGARVGRIQFDDFLTDAVLQFTEQALGGTQRNNSMFIVGNPANYAWSREGFDSIVTQLWNQMDGTGPPPMPKERIGEIPTVTVTEEQVNSKLQCSVCWEPFALGEPVRSLPCYHVYHGACICPWLELHATCPICRKSLTSEAGEFDEESVVRNVTLSQARNLQAESENNADGSGGPLSLSSLRARIQMNAQARAQARSNQADQTNPATVTVRSDARYPISVPMPSSSGSSTSWTTIPDSTSNEPPTMAVFVDDIHFESDSEND